MISRSLAPIAHSNDEQYIVLERKEQSNFKKSNGIKASEVPEQGQSDFTELFNEIINRPPALLILDVINEPIEQTKR